MAFQHHFRGGGHVQFGAGHLDEFRTGATQQAGKLVFGQRIGHGGDGTEDGGRIGPQHGGQGEGLPGELPAELEKVQRAAAVGQPAHDGLVAADELLAVDAEVLSRLARAARDDQPPGDQRGRIARPAVLDGQGGEVDVAACDDDILAGAAAADLRRHVHDLAQDGKLVPGVLQAAWRLGLLQVGQQPADFAQGGGGLLAHAEGDAFGGAEQVGEHGELPAVRTVGRLFEQQGGTTGAQDAVGDLGHFQPG